MTYLSNRNPVEENNEYFMGSSYTFNNSLKNDKIMYSKYRNHIKSKKNTSILTIFTENKVVNVIYQIILKTCFTMNL